MSTGAKIAIGCAVVAFLAMGAAVVGIGFSAWWLKGKADEMTGGTFHNARGDVEVESAQTVVSHAVPALFKVLDGHGEDCAAVLVPRARERRVFQSDLQVFHKLIQKPFLQASLLLLDPGSTLAAVLPMDACCHGPELLADMVPIEGDLGIREELLLERPDRFRSVGKEVDARELVGAVTAFDSFLI